MPAPVTKFQDLLNTLVHRGATSLHRGAPGQMLNAFKSFVPGQGGMLTRADETGMFGISPLSGQMKLQSTNGWGFDANPVTRSVRFNKGDFAIGGSFNKNLPSAYIKYGPVNVQGSLGLDPSIQMNINTGANKTQAAPTMIQKFLAGDTAPQQLNLTAREPTMMQEFLAGDTVPQQLNPTAREELEQQINQYRNSNPTWYRP